MGRMADSFTHGYDALVGTPEQAANFRPSESMCQLTQIPKATRTNLGFIFGCSGKYGRAAGATHPSGASVFQSTPSAPPTSVHR